MLVEAREHFDTTGRVVKLMAEPPEEFRFMAHSVPPIINKGRDDVTDCGTRPWAEVVTELNERDILKPLIPSQSGKNDNSDLNTIDE